MWYCCLMYVLVRLVICFLFLFLLWLYGLLFLVVLVGCWLRLVSGIVIWKSLCGSCLIGCLVWYGWLFLGLLYGWECWCIRVWMMMWGGWGLLFFMWLILLCILFGCCCFLNLNGLILCWLRLFFFGYWCWCFVWCFVCFWLLLVGWLCFILYGLVLLCVLIIWLFGLIVFLCDFGLFYMWGIRLGLLYVYCV